MPMLYLVVSHEPSTLRKHNLVHSTALTNSLTSTFPTVTGIQELLTSPNPDSPAQREAYETFQKNRKLYEQKIREQAARCAADT